MKIYTRDIAADVVELFENVLEAYNITVPSPEDDERDMENDARLYGSVYYELLDEVETSLLITLRQSECKSDDEVTIVPYRFSGGVE